MRVTVEPLATAALRQQVWPNAWKKGRQPMMTSSGPRCSRVDATIAAFPCRLPWVSSAPFGVPVVPEVYDAAGLQHAVIGDRELRHVGQHHADPVTDLKAIREQQRSQPGSGITKLA
jgi:hypothetical protein